MILLLHRVLCAPTISGALEDLSLLVLPFDADDILSSSSLGVGQAISFWVGLSLLAYLDMVDVRFDRHSCQEASQGTIT